MSIPLHDLRGDCGWLQSKFLADRAFNFWIDMCMCADCAAKFADANALERLHQPLLGATEFIEHQREFQAKCDWLGMNAVAPSDHRRHLKSTRMSGDGRAQRS